MREATAAPSISFKAKSEADEGFAGPVTVGRRGQGKGRVVGILKGVDLVSFCKSHLPLSFLFPPVLPLQRLADEISEGRILGRDIDTEKRVFSDSPASCELGPPTGKDPTDPVEKKRKTNRPHHHKALVALREMDLRMTMTMHLVIRILREERESVSEGSYRRSSVIAVNIRAHPLHGGALPASAEGGLGGRHLFFHSNSFSMDLKLPQFNSNKWGGEKTVGRYSCPRIGGKVPSDCSLLTRSRVIALF